MPTIHEATTAREIVGDFKGQRLDYFVTGYGTGGTVTGVGRVLRRERPEIKIILSEPANAQLVGSGVAHRDAMPKGARPRATPPSQPHPIQGWTPDFIPLVLQEAIDRKYYDELIPIAGAEGNKWARMLAPKGGHLHRGLGELHVRVAMQVAERAPGDR